MIPPFDWLGFALLCTALFGLKTGIADGQREGWSSDAIVVRLVLRAAATVAFVFWELHTPRALLDVRIFGNVELAAAALIAFIFLDLAPPWAVWAIVVRDLGITFLRSYTEYKGKPIESMRLAKTKTFLQFVLIGYVLLVYVASTSDALRADHGQLIESLLDETLVYASVIVVAAIKVLQIIYVAVHGTARSLSGAAGRSLSEPHRRRQMRLRWQKPKRTQSGRASLTPAKERPGRSGVLI